MVNWWLQPIKRHPSHGFISSVEHWRWWGYLSTAFTFFSGIVITTAAGSLPEGGIPPAFVVTFGVTNICVYFDFAPANMVLPLFWLFTVLFFMVFFHLKVERMRAEVADGLLSQRLFARLRFFSYFEASTFVVFMLIFAVSPVDVDQPYFKEHMWVHSMPYVLFQFGLLSLAISTTVHGVESGYWTKLGFGPFFRRGAVAYCVVFTFNVLYSTISITRCLVMMDPPHPATCTNSKAFTELNGLMIIINALIVPLVKSSIIIFCRADRMELLHVSPTLYTKVGTEGSLKVAPDPGTDEVVGSE